MSQFRSKAFEFPFQMPLQKTNRKEPVLMGLALYLLTVSFIE
ncbi:hypothetical protein JOD29_002427 [Lysinibacillus composti]|nr:hypothetical protein [Lysinibacillus composti]MBM7609161.1 hypothetical protein [Lysinibacillus composti]